MTGQAAHHYLVFETAGGCCGIAWNSVGITRFQLPTKSATATERILLRQIPDAKPGAPTPEVADAVAAVRRYFEGKETDFSMFKLDLGEPDPFFERVYEAARRPRSACSRWRAFTSSRHGRHSNLSGFKGGKASGEQEG